MMTARQKKLAAMLAKKLSQCLLLNKMLKLLLPVRNEEIKLMRRVN